MPDEYVLKSGLGGPSYAKEEDAPQLHWETDQPDAYRWTDRAFELLLDGVLSAHVRKIGGIMTASVTGKCPRCDHEVGFEQIREAVAGEALQVLGGQEPMAETHCTYVAVDVECRCGEGHPGRPTETRRGCGVNFRVEVRPEA